MISKFLTLKHKHYAISKSCKFNLKNKIELEIRKIFESATQSDKVNLMKLKLNLSNDILYLEIIFLVFMQ